MMYLDKVSEQMYLLTAALRTLPLQSWRFGCNGNPTCPAHVKRDTSVLEQLLSDLRLL